MIRGLGDLSEFLPPLSRSSLRWRAGAPANLRRRFGRVTEAIDRQLSGSTESAFIPCTARNSAQAWHTDGTDDPRQKRVLLNWPIARMSVG